MDVDSIKNNIENNYDMKITEIEKVKNTYKICSGSDEYCIKIIKYDFEHFKFILSAIEHLQRRGFETIPEIIENVRNEKYIKLDSNYGYLTKWVPSRTSNYNNPLELGEISKKLGELHNCSLGFSINRGMKPRIGWYSWINVFNTRCEEILDFKKRISQKAYKSDFDNIYLEYVESEIERGQKAIKGLKENNYLQIMDKEVKKRGFCHHDYAHHNILIDNDRKINIIDFDYCILDSHIHDLGSLLIRVMKDGKWNCDLADLIIENYCITNSISAEEMKLMKYFIMFPQSFWQIGLQYYWEQQPWGEEFFLNKIQRYIEDIPYREEFLGTYFR